MLKWKFDTHERKLLAFYIEENLDIHDVINSDILYNAQIIYIFFENTIREIK